MNRKIEYIDEEDRKWIKKYLIKCKAAEIIEKDIIKAAWYVENPPFVYMTVICTHDDDWWIGWGRMGEVRFMDTSGIYSECHVGKGDTVRDRFMAAVKVKLEEARSRYEHLRNAYTRKWERGSEGVGDEQKQQ